MYGRFIASAISHTLLTAGTGRPQVAVIFFLMIYSTVQASVRPFKLSHESTLDSASVLLLMLVFVADVRGEG
jgi:hypothetical protein